MEIKTGHCPCTQWNSKSKFNYKRAGFIASLKGSVYPWKSKSEFGLNFLSYDSY